VQLVRGREDEVEVELDLCDRGRSLADGGSHPFGRAVADVACHEHARHAGFGAVRSSLEGSAARRLPLGHDDREAVGSGVDRGRQTGRAGPDDHDVVLGRSRRVADPERVGDLVERRLDEGDLVVDDDDRQPGIDGAVFSAPASGRVALGSRQGRTVAGHRPPRHEAGLFARNARSPS
jgi:hypothetical protein